MTKTMRGRPDNTEFDPFYAGYVACVPEGDIVDVLRQGGVTLTSTLGAIPESKGGYRYADGKWSVREVVGHMIDTERVFSYRLLRVARGDATPLPAFDQDAYVLTSGAGQRTVESLAAEMALVRASTVSLLASLGDDAWGRRGVANGKGVTVCAMAYITAGHALHHLDALRSLYLTA